MADEIKTETIEEAVAAPKRRSYWRNIFHRLIREKPLGAVCFVIIIIFMLVAIFANFIAPYPMNAVDLSNILSGPSSDHWLGTDQLGRDELSNLIWGARISMIVGLSGTFLAIFVSTIIGSLSALIGGKFDLILQRFVDAWLAIPTMLILLIMMSIVGRSILNMTVVIAIPMGIGGSRLIRSAVLALKSNVYIDAAKASGAGTRQILTKHILPNIAPIIIISFSMQVGHMIMMAAALSFLGFGVPPGTPDWGSMLSQEGSSYMHVAPQLALWPGLCLTIVVYATNMFGDALRDILDPRLKGGVGRYGGKDTARKIEKFRARLAA